MDQHSNSTGAPAASRSGPLDRLGPPLLIVAATLLCFLPSVLRNDFVNWDDNINLTENPFYRGLTARHLRWMLFSFHGGHYHPLTWLSFGIDHALWGMWPVGYHLTSLLLHTGNALLFYLLCWRLLESRWKRGLPWACALAALFFAIHPLRVESVVWATERRDVLACFFLLLALLAYLRAVRGPAGLRWTLVSLACFAFSLLSKAWGITLPAILVVLDVWPLGRFSARTLAAKLPYAVLAALAAAAAIVAQRRGGAMLSLLALSPADRALQALYGLWFYPYKTLLPVGLSPLYRIEAASALDPKYLLSLLGVAGISVALFALRRRWPALLAAWICYAVLVSPVLGLVQSGPQAVADRYSYLACLPFALLVAEGLLRWWSPGLVRAAVLALTLLGLLTLQQTRVWHDSLALWSRVLSLDPGSGIGYANRALTLRMGGDLDGALRDSQQAVRLLPASPDAYLQRGLAWRARGERDRALADFSRAIELAPQEAKGYVQRGTAYQEEGRYDESIRDYDAALALDPANGRVLSNRGLSWQRKGEYGMALRDYDAALERDPSLALTYFNRALVLEALGQAQRAVRDLTRAIETAPPGSPLRADAEQLRAELAARP